MARNQNIELGCGQFVERAPPAFRASRIHERDRGDDKVAGDDQADLRIMDPQIRFGGGEGRDIDPEAAAADLMFGRPDDRPCRPKRLRMIHDVEGATDFGALLGRRPARIEVALGKFAAARKEAGESAVNGVGRVKLRARVNGPDVGIVGAVVEMPVGIDDSDDRQAARLGISEQLVAMGRVAPGVDQHQTVRRIEEDAVPVRPPIGDEAPRNEVISQPVRL